MPTYNFTKVINSDKLLFEISLASLPAPSCINTIDTDIKIEYQNSLSSEQETQLNSIVNAHVALTTSESLSIYLDLRVYPFVQKLIKDFAAENISMGVTQAQKTGPILGMFAKKYDVNNDSRSFSLKDTFDTGSLYESLKVLQHIRNNSSEYDGLTPFVTDARLLNMKNKIESFLGIQLST